MKIKTGFKKRLSNIIKIALLMVGIPFGIYWVIQIIGVIFGIDFSSGLMSTINLLISNLFILYGLLTLQAWPIWVIFGLAYLFQTERSLKHK